MPIPIIICIDLKGFTLALHRHFLRVIYKLNLGLGGELRGVTGDRWADGGAITRPLGFPVGTRMRWSPSFPATTATAARREEIVGALVAGGSGSRTMQRGRRCWTSRPGRRCRYKQEEEMWRDMGGQAMVVVGCRPRCDEARHSGV